MWHGTFENLPCLHGTKPFCPTVEGKYASFAISEPLNPRFNLVETLNKAKPNHGPQNTVEILAVAVKTERMADLRSVFGALGGNKP